MARVTPEGRRRQDEEGVTPPSHDGQASSESEHTDTTEPYAQARLLAEIHTSLEAIGIPTDVVTGLAIKKLPPGMNGDIGFACHRIAKMMQSTPLEAAAVLAAQLNAARVQVDSNGTYITSYQAVDGYVNATIDYSAFGADVIRQVAERKSTYGSENIGHGAHIVIDMSSPNIAKPMSVGHLRSTIIGDALARMYKEMGYRVTKDNHIGDWGTQFGHLLYAIELWGDMDVIAANPIEELKNLYVRVTEAGEADEEVKNQGRERFRRLEQGDPEARALWQKIVDWSLAEFQDVYDVLGVEFDEVKGESFYEPLLAETMKMVKESGITKESKGAEVFDLTEFNLGVAIFLKSNGGTVYLTRDIATAIHRQETMAADGMIYVVGGDQQQYFQQLIKAMELLGYPIAEKTKHVWFGLINLPDPEDESKSLKMSTRKGRTVLLMDVIKEAQRRATEVIVEKTQVTDEGERAKLVDQVAVGALKFNDLMRDPTRNVVFKWEEALNSEGKSASYIQYSHARACSVLRNSGVSEVAVPLSPLTELSQPSEKVLVALLAEYPAAVRKATEEYNPSIIATATYELAQAFSNFYHELSILKAEGKDREHRLQLTAAFATTVKNGLSLLGIAAPERM